jgi:hypothetical protein
MPESRHDWLDDDAGPVVRPYTVTGGRVRPTATDIDLVAFVLAASAPAEAALAPLQPEHQAIIDASQEPISVAELSAHLDLPLGVVRVLLGDLLAAELIVVHEPPQSQFPDDNIIEAVVNGLRAL